LLAGHSNAFSEEVHRPSALLVFGEHAREIITTGKYIICSLYSSGVHQDH
jgi:hypothetical protein